MPLVSLTDDERIVPCSLFSWMWRKSLMLILLCFPDRLLSTGEFKHCNLQFKWITHVPPHLLRKTVNEGWTTEDWSHIWARNRILGKSVSLSAFQNTSLQTNRSIGTGSFCGCYCWLDVLSTFPIQFMLNDVRQQSTLKRELSPPKRSSETRLGPENREND